MEPDFLQLPTVPAKPRRVGVTHMLDKGVPLHNVTSILRSYGQHVDYWKFGWGTSYVEADLADKLAILNEHDVVACVGGTLLELAWAQHSVDACLAWARRVGFRAVEVSRGSVPMSLTDKSMIIRQAKRHFTVLAETGYKSADRVMSGEEWIAEIAEDLDSGAEYAVTEGRESGTVGVYDHHGEPKPEIVAAVVKAAGLERALFEAPRKNQQAWFINSFGALVNLGNIAPEDALAVHTLRRGLRADTLALGGVSIDAGRR